METHPYQQAFADRDLDRLVALLADDVVFHSPVISKRAEGRDSVAALYAMILGSFNEVEFTHDLGDEGGTHIFIANARVLGKPLKVTTTLEFNADGKIREIWASARAMSGVVAIAEAIGSRLAAHRGRPGLVFAIRTLAKIQAASQAAVTDWVGSRLIPALNR